MTYKALVEFLQHRMRMSHIYQPVMLMTLLKNRGRCHETEVAKAITTTLLTGHGGRYSRHKTISSVIRAAHVSW